MIKKMPSANQQKDIKEVSKASSGKCSCSCMCVCGQQDKATNTANKSSNTKVAYQG